MTRFSTPLLLALAVVLGAGAGIGGYFGWQAWAERGPEQRPEFTLPDLDGEERNISEWDGKVVVLNFWGSWCPPCVHEIPMFVDLQDAYGDRGLQFVGVAVDRLADARRFHDELSMNYPSLIGVHDANEIGERYGNELGTLPYTVIIDRDGFIVQKFAREVDRETLEPAILPHL
ncbi:MAG: TlpA disulfide reductase family protein [Aquisalimonadaceae bacterium]